MHQVSCQSRKEQSCKVIGIAAWSINLKGVELLNRIQAMDKTNAVSGEKADCLPILDNTLRHKQFIIFYQAFTMQCYPKGGCPYLSIAEDERLIPISILSPFFCFSASYCAFQFEDLYTQIPVLSSSHTHIVCVRQNLEELFIYIPYFYMFCVISCNYIFSTM